MPSCAFKPVGSDELKKMKLCEVLSHVKKAVRFLKETEDYSTKDVGDAIHFMARAREIDPIKVAKKARHHGLAKQFVKIVRSLESFFTSSDNSEQGAKNLTGFLTEFTNSAKRCPAFGIDLAKHGGVEYIITLLKRLNKQKMDAWLQTLIRQLLSCLYNSIRHDVCSVNRSIYRKAGVVDFMKTLVSTSHKTAALMILSYIVDEGESEILGKDNTTVVYMVGLFKEAAASEDHTARVDRGDIISISTYELMEIANGLSNLIVNDTNKKAVFQSGGIPVMNSMLTAGFSAEEQTLAAKLLWSLSFDEEVQKSDAIKDSLKALTRLTSSKDRSVRSACKNAVWQISGQHSAEKCDVKKKSAQASPIKGSGHIMISYNWTHQQLALQIRDELEAAGYKVWIDVDKMEDDILDSMADAVAKSAVVLLCMTQQYHASQNCRSEATYAYKKKKPVIPLLLEADYDPQGWLDILIGTKLYYKLFSKQDVQKNMGELMKAVGRQCQQLGVHADNTEGAVKSKNSETTASASPSTSEACSWSNERVLQWFDEIKLPQLKEVLDFCDGSDLKDIYEKSSRDSELFEKDFKSNFGLEYKDILRLKSALKKLF